MEDSSDIILFWSFTDITQFKLELIDKIPLSNPLLLSPGHMPAMRGHLSWGGGVGGAVGHCKWTQEEREAADMDTARGMKSGEATCKWQKNSA